MATLQIVTELPRLVRRAADSNKGSYGKDLVVAGSRGMSGAAVLCGSGALRGGAGLVTVMTDAETAKLVHSASTESMTWAGSDVREFLQKKSAVLIGPGLPDTERAYEWVRKTVASIDLPMIIDASALNATFPQIQLSRLAEVV